MPGDGPPLLLLVVMAVWWTLTGAAVLVAIG
jgi:hypothetical protein